MPQRKKTDCFSLLCGGLLLLGSVSISGFAHADDKHSTTLTGTLGLNTIPNARMDEKGTVRIGASTSDPYVHTYMGFQLAKSFYVSLRQPGEVSSIHQKPDNLYPGLDMKLRLMEETATRPAIAIGFESAYGHKRIGSEYVTLSKRINNFDITGGIAWGRMGSAGHVHNPLASLSSHFDKRRDFNLEQAQDIRDWFTGQDMGFFGGVEYFTPLDGLSLKAEYGANDYVGERRNIPGFNAPAPWSVSLNYKPWDQIDLSAGVIGGEKVMARLSVQDQIFNWPGKPDGKRDAPAMLSKRQAVGFDNSGRAALLLSPYQSSARQIGHVARYTANNMPPDEEQIAIKLNHKGLKGPTVTLIRRDLEEAVIRNHGSPEEI